MPIAISSNLEPSAEQKSLLQCAARFNERLVLSLASNPNCLLMDDELNVLPTSSHVKSIVPIPMGEDGRPDVPDNGAEAAAELKGLRESLADTQVHGPPNFDKDFM